MRTPGSIARIKTLLVASLLISGLAACTKTSNSNLTPEQRFSGRWKWVLTTGGFVGVHITPTDVKHDIFYTFNSNHTYKIEDGSTIKTGTWNVGVDSSTAGLKFDTIGMSGGQPFIYSFSNDSLFLNSYCCDNFNYTLKVQ